MRAIAALSVVAALSGCGAYNSPGRFLGMMPPDRLALIEPEPLAPTCTPDCPRLHAPPTDHAYIPNSVGPTYGPWR